MRYGSIVPRALTRRAVPPRSCQARRTRITSRFVTGSVMAPATIDQIIIAAEDFVERH